MTHWWRRDELRALLQAWEQSLAAPRDREAIGDDELQRLYARFDELRPRDADAIPIRDVEAQRQRLVRTFLFQRAFDAESTRGGRPTWFQLPPTQQDALRRMNSRLGELAAVTPDEFEIITRICEEPAAPPQQQQKQQQQQSTPMADEMQAAAEALAGLPMFRPTQQPRPTLSPSLSPPSSPVKKGVEGQEAASDSDELSVETASDADESSEYAPAKKSRKDRDMDADYTPPKGKGKAKAKISKWSKRDEKRLISAWHEVVTLLAENGFAGSFASRNEGLRLNSLIHQRYVELCDTNAARTNQSTGAKKHAIMMAFRSLRGVLRTLASLSERPNWFGMTPDERMELQKMHGHHHDHACLIEKDTYQQLGEIDRAQRLISTPTANALRPPTTLNQILGRTKEGGGGSSKKGGKTSGKGKHEGGPPRGYVVTHRSSEESSEGELSDDGASSRNGRAETSSRSANPQALVISRHPRSSLKEVARRSSREVNPADDIASTDGSSPPKRRRTGLTDAKWVTRLLDAQTQRFEALLAEFQEERRQERQHNMEIILEALKLRSASAQKPDQPSQCVEALVEKQRQHMLELFNQLQDERSQEREQARMLLGELGAPRLVSSQDQEHKDG
ncbi:hypothetical protein PR003_g5369 [Phytophthora rubi]|uniref:Uncharacterized protein n=1 Tax=Phytophthora rubi TaxID=129364 RepID=A0A6A3N7U6_9STRA|nr:hypothetical protein PR002_g5026 [Phytophthora rubi]KAE9044795.1 hypothetical protein PR001_g5227 [Phytophthora rubi]KAE9350432.1 hypothetical protein PR003_g5369 [Phytophthora rubi]